LNRWRTGSQDQVNLVTDQLGCKVGQPLEFPLCISVLDQDVFSLHVPKLAQTLHERFKNTRR
jgi:hypothetical protein